MLTPFRAEKLIQAAAVLLKATEPHRMSRLRLLKLLYIADRESIQETGFPITGDEVLAMPHGPVLEATYECIQDQHFHSQAWRRHIDNDGKHDVVLVEDPGVAQLSRYDVTKLQDVARRFEEMPEWELVEHTHSFPEWIKNQPEPGGRGSRRIPVKDILEAVGLGAEADEILAEAKSYRSVEQLLNSTP